MTADHETSPLNSCLRHAHDVGAPPASHETRTRWVVALTLVTMVAELVVGFASNSMALTADGWHMATHAGALGMAAFAYWFARSRAGSSAYSFGTGKVHALAGYTNAIVLALVALWMVVESVERFVRPEAIDFGEALPIAVLGLVVNLVSAKLLQADDGEHGHGHGGHGHGGHGHGGDQNLRAAYMHVLADALTSVLAILALLGGRYFGWMFLDGAMGILGGVVIARWSYGLCQQAARQLLDAVPSPSIEGRIREALESQFAGVSVLDLHVWEIGPSARACIVSLAAAAPESPLSYRAVIDSVARVSHVTVEVHAVGPDEHARSTPA